jgi:hypothetical protein
MEGGQPGGELGSLENLRPGTVIKVFEDGPPARPLRSAGPAFGPEEHITGGGTRPPEGAAPSGLFRQRALEDPESLLPGSVLKVWEEDVPESASFGPESRDAEALPEGLFRERALEDPESLLPGSVIRFY